MGLNNIIELSKGYIESVFDMGLKQEYNIGEVLLASLYRQVGWQAVKDDKNKRFGEAQVNDAAKVFFNGLEKSKESRDENAFENQDWKTLVYKTLSSPKMPNQVKSKFPILYPFIPDCALYSSASRSKGNPWNPGNLIEKTILLGANEKQRAEILWEKVFISLSSNPSDKSEDVFARLLSNQFLAKRPDNLRWSLNSISHSIFQFDTQIICNAPAHQFVEDLEKVLELKHKLTRRHWLSILESLLRIGCASHLLWQCSMNNQLWRFLRSRFEGIKISEVELKNNFNTESKRFWKPEELAVFVIKGQIQSYIRSQIAINYILKKLEIEEGSSVSLNSISDILDIGNKLEQKSYDNGWKNLISDINDLYDNEPKLISCKYGFTKSIFEYIRYSLGQKQTADIHKRNFDQSFWLRKKANYPAAPWIVDLGPASILCMVYCCSHGHDQNRTLSDFLNHLERYGFIVDQKDFEISNMFSILSTLQVIRDSPDAEGGMVIINPYK
jgi:hypothetical protein